MYIYNTTDNIWNNYARSSFEIGDLTKASNRIRSAYALKGLKNSLRNFISSDNDIDVAS